jgi:hypothetical protein
MEETSIIKVISVSALFISTDFLRCKDLLLMKAKMDHAEHLAFILMVEKPTLRKARISSIPGDYAFILILRGPSRRWM